MIDAKQAAQIAHQYLVDIIGVKPRDVLIEEIEQTHRPSGWSITLGYTLNLTSGSFGFDQARQYKRFIIESADGTVKSMKIWKPGS